MTDHDGRNVREARFLQAREIRTPKNKHRADVHAFWRDVRRELTQWEESWTVRSAVTAAQRREAQQELHQLQRGLKDIQKRALSSCPELSTADIRLLHQVFTKHTTELEQARDELCPRFEFKRYRAAMKERNIPSMEEPPVPQPEPLLFQYDGKIIRDQKGAKIIEDAHGTITLQTHDGTVSQLELDHEDTSLTLRDLTDCDITLSMPYKALYMIRLEHTTVRVTGSMDGAVHVTSCAHTSVVCRQCHQLRIHDSRALRFLTKTQTGPILEDSTDISLVVAPDDSVTGDVKDFSWLRNVPSPNYQIVVIEEDNHAQETKRHEPPKEVHPKAPTTVSPPTDNTESDDDDDEL